jgi:undecaprenyl pyrophosphate phosphatase UppP
MGMPAYVSFAFLIVMRLLCIICTLVVIKRDIVIKVSDYAKKVLWPILYITVITTLIGLVVDSVIPQTFVGLMAVCFVCVIISSTLIVAIGLSADERVALIAKAKSLFSRFK